MRRTSYLLIFAFLTIPSVSAHAENFMQWQSTNIQALRGHDYKIGENQATTITLEHVHGWKYGDTLAWIDFIKPDGQDHTYYGEISPRLSLSKVFNTNLSHGIVKDILISTTFEKAKDQGPQYLYGGAIDFNLPNFKFFKANAYIHDSTEIDGQTWQVTLAWNRPFKIGKAKFVAEGFADIQGSEGNKEPNQLIAPRFLLDIGDLAGHKPRKLFVGIEYQYWHNKFGIDGIIESAPQAQIKWVF